MTGLGIQAWLQFVNGLRIALVHSELMEMLEILHVLGNSYRLATLGVGSGVVLSRFTVGFCRAAITRAICDRAWRVSILEARTLRALFMMVDGGGFAENGA